MYVYFQGRLTHKSPAEIIIDVQGIGYRLLIPFSLYNQLPNAGESIFVYTSWVVREMSQTLYAFFTVEQRDLFEILLNLPGIGPRTALAIIGYIEPSELQEAVLIGDTKKLTQIPGIGKKTAERLLIDLQGKIKLSNLSPHKNTASSRKIQDALNALLHLGCSQNQAEKAVKKAADELTEECDLSTLIASALKYQ